MTFFYVLQLVKSFIVVHTENKDVFFLQKKKNRQIGKEKRQLGRIVCGLETVEVNQVVLQMTMTFYHLMITGGFIFYIILKLRCPVMLEYTHQNMYYQCVCINFVIMQLKTSGLSHKNSALHLLFFKYTG